MLIKKRTVHNFIFFLIVFLIFSCKNEVKDNSIAGEGEEQWLKDYVSPDIKWGYIDKNGKIAIDLIYDDVRDFKDGIAIANMKGKWGYIDVKGNVLIPFSFLNAYEFNEGLARVQDFNKKFYFIDKQGKKAFDCIGNECSDFEGETASFSKEELKGLMNKKGEKLIDAAFSMIKKIDASKYIVSQGDLYGVIDGKGSFLIKPAYEKITMLDNENLAFKKNGTYTWIDSKTLNPKTQKVYRKLSSTQEGHISFKDDKTSGIMDLKGNVVYASSGDLMPGGEGFWIEIKENKSQLIDLKGNKIGPSFDQLYKMSNGMVGYQQGELWGYMDKNGSEIIPPTFRIIWDAYEDRIRFANENGYGFLDVNGKLKVLPKYVEARDYKNGFARIASY